MTPPLALSDFDFALPPELIAQQPMAERSASRLLDGRADVAVDRHFRDLPGLLRAGDLLVVNDTAVIKARLLGVKASGGVRTTADAQKMVEAGANRLGASASVAIVTGQSAGAGKY